MEDISLAVQVNYQCGMFAQVRISEPSDAFLRCNKLQLLCNQLLCNYIMSLSIFTLQHHMKDGYI